MYHMGDYNFAKIGERIATERRSAGYTQEELSERIYCDRRSLIEWEKGRRPPSLETMLVLCNLFDCKLGWLLCDPEYTCRDGRTTDICKETGLSPKAAESLIGISECGGKDALVAINTLLEHEDIWRFLGPEGKEVTAENPLTAIGAYFSDTGPENGLVISGEDGPIRIQGGDYKRLKALIDRTLLDAVQDALKNTKNATPGD